MRCFVLGDKPRSGLTSRPSTRPGFFHNQTKIHNKWLRVSSCSVLLTLLPLLLPHSFPSPKIVIFPSPSSESPCIMTRLRRRSRVDNQNNNNQDGSRPKGRSRPKCQTLIPRELRVPRINSLARSREGLTRTIATNNHDQKEDQDKM